MVRKAATSSMSRNGFSLIEVAIVLSIVGVVLAGVWQFADTAWSNTRREQTYEAVVTVVNNFRQIAGGILNMDPTQTKALLNPILINRGVIPSYLLRQNTTSCSDAAQSPMTGTACADTPFGYPKSVAGLQSGTFIVCNWSVGDKNCDGPSPTNMSFAVQLLELDMGTCIQLSGKLSSASGPPGLIDVDINGENVINGRTRAGNGTLPVAASDLNVMCKYGSINSVAFIYRLNPGL